MVEAAGPKPMNIVIVDDTFFNVEVLEAIIEDISPFSKIHKFYSPTECIEAI